jgi:predicted nucleic acid-binding protein
MSGDVFLDTNVCIYALNDQGENTSTAKGILARGGVISVQVLNEYTAVARRTLKLDWDAIERDLHKLIHLVDDILPLSLSANVRARDIAERHNLQFYDSLLLASALEAGCARFVSEDMQDGFVVDGLRVENPFRN